MKRESKMTDDGLTRVFVDTKTPLAQIAKAADRLVELGSLLGSPAEADDNAFIQDTAQRLYRIADFVNGVRALPKPDPEQTASGGT